MMTSEAAAALPILAALKEASERWLRRERARARLASGVGALDALLGGGWPQGKVGELVGPASSGRSAVAAATVAAATARGEVAAWIDAADAFDPASAAAAGVELGRVLWVRPCGAAEAVRAAELVLETGGFTVVVLDLGSAFLDAGVGVGWSRVGAALAAAGPVSVGRVLRACPEGTGGSRRERARSACSTEATDRNAGVALAPARGQRHGALRLRLARAVERASAVALVLAERPWVGTLAGATVALRRGGARWEGERGGPRWLEGLVLRAQVERGAACAAPRGAARASAGPAPAREKADAAIAAARESASRATLQARYRIGAAAGPVSVGRALRACPESGDGSERKHARSARSTETGDLTVVPGTTVIARSPAAGGVTKQSRSFDRAIGRTAGATEGA